MKPGEMIEKRLGVSIKFPPVVMPMWRREARVPMGKAKGVELRRKLFERTVREKLVVAIPNHRRLLGRRVRPEVETRVRRQVPTELAHEFAKLLQCNWWTLVSTSISLSTGCVEDVEQ